MAEQKSTSIKPDATVTVEGASVTLVVSVVVCTYNRYDVLPDCLHSLELQSLDAGKFEIIIVDNSDDIASQERFWEKAELRANTTLIVERVPGLSRARNIGVNAAKGRIVAFIDDDAIASSDWLAEIINVFSLNADCGVAGGPVAPIWPANRPPWLHPWLEGFLTIVDLGPDDRPLASTEWLAGTNIGFRRDLLSQVGGFSETLGRIKGTLLSNEELGVSRSIHALNFKSYYSPRARVSHRVHADRISQKWMRRRVSWQVVSDFMAGSGRSQDGKALWKDLGDYQLSLPPDMRGVRGLFYDTQDPALFQKQCRAIEALVELFLGSAVDPDPN